MFISNSDPVTVAREGIAGMCRILRHVGERQFFLNKHIGTACATTHSLDNDTSVCSHFGDRQPAVKNMCDPGGAERLCCRLPAAVWGINITI